MYKRISLAALAAFMTSATAATAMAADLAPPPPPAPAPQIRSSINDWTGPYLGGVIGGTCMDGTYDRTTSGGASSDPDLRGCGFDGGFVGGYNYQIGQMLFGAEGDFTFGGKTGKNISMQDNLYVDWKSSLRGRLGYISNDDTLFYFTGGVAWLHAKWKDTGTNQSVKNTHTGFVIGGGIEHAMTENIHLRAEYLYSNYNDKDYTFNCSSCGVGGGAGTVTGTTDLGNVHTFRLGVTWNFPVSSW